MQRRLNGRDILYFGGLAVILITIILAMYMVDRQWQKLAGMEQLMHEQANDLREISGQVRNLEARIGTGTVVAANNVQESEAAVPAAFRRSFEATQLADYAPGDWLVQAFGVNLKSLTPFISSDTYSSRVQALSRRVC